DFFEAAVANHRRQIGFVASIAKLTGQDLGQRLDAIAAHYGFHCAQCPEGSQGASIAVAAKLTKGGFCGRICAGSAHRRGARAFPRETRAPLSAPGLEKKERSWNRFRIAFVRNRNYERVRQW